MSLHGVVYRPSSEFQELDVVLERVSSSRESKHDRQRRTVHDSDGGLTADTGSSTEHKTVRYSVFRVMPSPNHDDLTFFSPEQW
jgi:hypothetical protein